MRYSTLAIVDFEYYSVNFASCLRTKVLEGGVNSKWDERGKTNGNPDSCDLGCVQKEHSGGISSTFGCGKHSWKPKCKYCDGQWDAPVAKAKPVKVAGDGNKVRVSGHLMSTINDCADHLTPTLKNFGPEAFSVMTRYTDTNCCIGNAVTRPFSTCTLTSGNLFIPT